MSKHVLLDKLWMSAVIFSVLAVPAGSKRVYSGEGAGFVWPFGTSWESLFDIFPQGCNYWVTNPLAHRKGSDSASQQNRKRKYSSIQLPSIYTIAKVLNAVSTQY